jgi:hypothetical protein
LTVHSLIKGDTICLLLMENTEAQKVYVPCSELNDKEVSFLLFRLKDYNPLHTGSGVE